MGIKFVFFHAENKFEIRISKSETISNDKKQKLKLSAASCRESSTVRKLANLRFAR